MTLIAPIPGAFPLVDLSSRNEDDQHQIDWPTLARYLLSLHPEAGVIVKLSQGDWYRNPFGHRQRMGAHAAGLKNVGLYHYVELVSGSTGKGLSGSDNAKFFLQTVGDDGGILPNEFLAGDWEDQSAGPGADLDACALDFGGVLSRALGIAPLLYSASWYADPHNLNRDPALAQFPAWWAAYQNTIPPTPEPWASRGKGIACWQFTSQAQLPGLPNPCDVSWWLGGLPLLRSIQWPPPDPLNGPTDPPPDCAVDQKGNATDIPHALLSASGHLKQIYGKIPDPNQNSHAGTAKANIDACIRSLGLLP
jgi:GH25 family lysozyme M1 (1,4-beta-N-acetylmuramidase)